MLLFQFSNSQVKRIQTLIVLSLWQAFIYSLVFNPRNSFSIVFWKTSVMAESVKKEVACPLSAYAKNLPDHVLRRYKEKISVVGIDPFLIAQKQLDKECLPPIESTDLVSFLVLETSFYSSQQFKGYKSLQAYNQMVSRFVNNVQGQVINGNFVITGQVRHSQKLTAPCVNLWVIATKNGAILSAHCDCMAGLGECCSHVASVLFYVEVWNRIKGKLACTDKKCEWIMPQFVENVPYAEVKDINFTSASKLKRDLDEKIAHLETSSSPAAAEISSTKQGESHDILPPSSDQLDELYQKLGKCEFKPVVLSLIHPYSDSYIAKSNRVQTIPDLFDNKFLKMEYHELLKACADVRIELPETDRALIEKDTRKQAGTSLFYRHRAGRIGASLSKQASHTNPAQPSQSLINTICYPKLFTFTSAATEHGCRHERLAITTFEETMKTKHKNFKIQQCGTFIHPEHQWLHATPDFLCSCDCCGEGCGEVKCPYCLKDSDFSDYVQRRNACLYSEGNEYRLKKNHQYFYQVQQQLFTTGRMYCDFVVCAVSSRNHVELASERIYPDNEHWDSVLPKLSHFWRYCILPEILGRWYTQKRDLTIQSPEPNAACFCRGNSEVATLSCSNDTCPIVRYHPSCLKIKEVSNSWLCPLCQTSGAAKKNASKAKPKNTAAVFERAGQLPSVCVCKKKAVQSERLLECHNNQCQNGQFFHLDCMHYKRMPNNAARWLCPVCKVRPRQFSANEEVLITGISTGASEKFAELSNLTDQHYRTIQSPTAWLDYDIIHHAHVLLRNIDGTMEGLQRPTLGPCRNFTMAKNSFIQILHTGSNHWVCVSNVRSDDGLVDLYDSLYHNVIANEVEAQVKNLVGNENFTGVRVVGVQQQGNGSDCGVYAIAFATCLINGNS